VLRKSAKSASGIGRSYTLTYLNYFFFSMPWTYAKAGVDIKKEQGVVKALSAEMTRIKQLKGFSGLFELPFDAQHLLAISTDGVGSKVLIAAELNKWDTLGIDCIAR